jgi:hypothetical protein
VAFEVKLSGVSLAILPQPLSAVPEFKGGELLPFLLLSLLAVALLMGMTCLFFVLRFRRSGRSKAFPSTSHPGLSEARKPRPLLFDSPNRWLAVRGTNPEAVQMALGLHNVMTCSWEQGLAEAQDFKLFVSPPINGWILIFGLGLPDPSDDVDDTFKLILSVSRTLGQVQFFGANRAINSHAWVWADHGRIFRAYAWSGTTLWNQGAITTAEAELGLTCFDYAEAIPQNPPHPGTHRGNAEKVPLLAGRWSLDPTTLDESAIYHRTGIIGSLSFPKPH